MAENTTQVVASGFIHLDPGASFPLGFKADRGPVEIEVSAKHAFALGPPSRGPNGPQHPPPLGTEGGIRVSAFPPGGSEPLHINEQESGSDRPQLLRFDVQAGQEGVWTCECSNIVNQPRRCRAIVKFTHVVDVTIVGTVIPVRLLNRTFATLLRALSPQIVLEEDKSFVDISQEARHFLGDGFERITFEKQVTNLKLDPRSPLVVTCAMPTGAGGHVPALFVDVNFVPRIGPTGKLRGVMDVTNVRVVLILTLRAGGELGSRQIFPNADVAVFIDESELELFNVPGVLGPVSLTDDLIEEALEVILEPFKDTSDAKVVKKVIEEIELAIRRPEVLHPIGGYITAALRQLARRDHVFHDLVVENGNWRVDHLSPDAVGSFGDHPDFDTVKPVPPHEIPGLVVIGSPGGEVVVI